MSVTDVNYIEQSQDLTNKSLKISKQVILEKYAQEREALVTEKSKALAAFYKKVVEDWGQYDDFLKILSETIVARAKSQVLDDMSDQTRLRNLLNKVMGFEIPNNVSLWEFPNVVWRLPGLGDLLTYCSAQKRIVDSKFNKVEGFDEKAPLYSVTYAYSSNIVNSLDYNEDFKERYSLEDSLPEYEIEVILPHNISLTIYQLSEILEVTQEVEKKLDALSDKEENIDKHLEKLEAQLLVKELQDSGNKEALDTIQSIIQSATGDTTLTIGSK